MRSLDSFLSRAGDDLEQHTRDIARKADLANQEWSGEARKAFDVSHHSLESHTNMKPGDSKTIEFPIPEGDIYPPYPPKKE